MGLPTPAVKTGTRKVRVQAITGPIRTTNAVGGTKLGFRLMECTVDGRKSDGRDLTPDEARQIKWLVREEKKGGALPFTLAPGPC